MAAEKRDKRAFARAMDALGDVSSDDSEQKADDSGSESESSELKQCLSIQSHVVKGYVGNKCAVFPLQLFGFDVSAINSVQFSNHTGYPTWRGQVMNGSQLWDIVDGLDENDLLGFSHLITGYARSASFLQTLVRVLDRLREKNPELVYVCDPVMGDNGELYVAPQLVEVYRDHVVQRATLLTPNQFEAQLLSGVRITDVQSALAACDALHSRGARTVVITSLELQPVTITLLVSTPRDCVAWVADMGKSEQDLALQQQQQQQQQRREQQQQRSAGEDDNGSVSTALTDGTLSTQQQLSKQRATKAVFRQLAVRAKAVKEAGLNVTGPWREQSHLRFTITLPKFDAYFTGTGDLTAALLLAWMDRLPTDHVLAVESAVASVHTVCRRTHAASATELRLVQNVRALRRPSIRHRAVFVTTTAAPPPPAATVLLPAAAAAAAAAAASGPSNPSTMAGGGGSRGDGSVAGAASAAADVSTIASSEVSSLY